MGKRLLRKSSQHSPLVYDRTIKPIESYAVIKQKFNDPKIFTLWHNRLGHPGSCES